MRQQDSRSEFSEKEAQVETEARDRIRLFEGNAIATYCLLRHFFTSVVQGLQQSGQDIMIRIIVLTTLLISCANKPEQNENVVPVIGKLVINEDWASCESTAECTFNYDKCGNNYVFNKSYIGKFSELSKNSNLLCYDLVRKPNVKSVECVKQKCKGITDNSRG